MGDRFGRYSKYIIQDRALPDVRDGLKPVQRRILYAMWKEGNLPNKPYRKSAKTVGTVIGNYHPHGDSSVYEAMVRLSQDWKMRMPLVDMQGNNGSIDNDPAAAMRYTEARLAPIALDLIKDIDKEMAYTPLTGADDLEKTFKLTKDDGGNWTISIEDYKELAEALVDHDESGSRAVYAERIHKNLSDYQPEDSSDSSSKSSSKDK